MVWPPYDDPMAAFQTYQAGIEALSRKLHSSEHVLVSDVPSWY